MRFLYAKCKRNNGGRGRSVTVLMIGGIWNCCAPTHRHGLVGAQRHKQLPLQSITTLRPRPHNRRGYGPCSCRGAAGRPTNIAINPCAAPPWTIHPIIHRKNIHHHGPMIGRSVTVLINDGRWNRCAPTRAFVVFVAWILVGALRPHRQSAYPTGGSLARARARSK